MERRTGERRHSKWGWQAGAAIGSVIVFAPIGCGEPSGKDESRLSADPPYSKEPDWRSADQEANSLGAGLGDINGDGFADLVVATGNDLAKQAVVVFYNDGKGGFPATPSWSSSDLDYHTGIAVGDIDLDGAIDVAVTVGPEPSNTEDQGYAKVYMNRGGELEKEPSYRTADRFSAFGCALGDHDGDGDLDLAVPAAFEGSGTRVTAGPVRIYENVGGRLTPRPAWQSAPRVHASNVKFADIDGDGLLDMAVAARTLPIHRARIEGDGSVTLPVDPWWRAPEEIGMPFFLDVGQVGSSLVLVTSYNDYMFVPPDDLAPGLSPAPEEDVPVPLIDAPPPPEDCPPAMAGSVSRVMAYAPLEGASPIWRSDTVGWGAGVRLADLNGDGVQDLLAARWGPNFYGLDAPLEIYLGTSRSFQTRPGWVSRTCSVGEAVLLWDLDEAAVEQVSESFQVERPQAIVTLARQLVQKIVEVRRNDVALGPRDYVTVPGGNWISFRERLRAGEEVSVRYEYSPEPDIVLTNTQGSNYVFHRR
jgi:hypothetical protein